MDHHFSISAYANAANGLNFKPLKPSGKLTELAMMAFASYFFYLSKMVIFHS